MWQFPSSTCSITNTKLVVCCERTGVQLKDNAFLLAASLRSLFSFLFSSEWSVIVRPLYFFQGNFPCNSWRVTEIPPTIKNMHTLYKGINACKNLWIPRGFPGLSGFVWLFIFNLLNSHFHNSILFFFLTFKITGCSIYKRPCKLLFFGPCVQRWGQQLCQ